MDEVAARADAKAIADMKPFAVLNGANQTPAWSEELAANKIMCLANCSLAVPEALVKERAPYLWGTGPMPEQAGDLTAALVTKLLKGKNADLRRRRREEQEARVRRRPLRHRRRPADGRRSRT